MHSKSKRVRITLDENLVWQVDRVARRLKISRSAFVRQALSETLKRVATLEREAKHRSGYEEHPVERDEFSSWAAEQAWPE
jgi:metal-responsive CopG/Arc/MetJ family transcriptional regulator